MLDREKTVETFREQEMFQKLVNCTQNLSEMTELQRLEPQVNVVASLVYCL